ncbi:aminoglycoside phosphotransferase family protein [Aspergillus alliaceus]|uniref:aminoglycoside phosphotransferase family protein n=1 Tax=Petromyces alliaceus TaxID=209559 RepID=UPI0012A5E9E2|nr:kinase-like domain-containing protein [Aspergillus alliaceus]KAB8229001.1 kinase-like domain-containing protein [Aspergillus alliaceus]
MAPTEPCSACSWTTERQEGRRYRSHVRLFYAVSDRGIWSLRSNLVLREKGAILPVFEAPNLWFVQANTSIPVPTVVECWKEEDDHALLLTKRIPSEPLSTAWLKLSADQRETIAKQTADYLLQLRELQSDRIQALDGYPATDDKLKAEMECGLQESVPETVRQRLRRRMLPATPFTFTHGDLTNLNIMVQDCSFTGIIDWETSAYLPVWWEHACTLITDSCQGLSEDREWKALLRKYMPDHSDGLESLLDYYHLCRGHDNERAARFIKETKTGTR